MMVVVVVMVMTIWRGRNEEDAVNISAGYCSSLTQKVPCTSSGHLIFLTTCPGLMWFAIRSQFQKEKRTQKDLGDCLVQTFICLKTIYANVVVYR